MSGSSGNEGWGGLLMVVGFAGVAWFAAWSTKGRIKSKVPDPSKFDDTPRDYDSPEAIKQREKQSKEDEAKIRQAQQEAEEKLRQAKEEAQQKFDQIANEALKKIREADLDTEIRKKVVEDTEKELQKAREVLVDKMTDAYTPTSVLKGCAKIIEHEVEMVKKGFEAASSKLQGKNQEASEAWEGVKQEKTERNKAIVSTVRNFIPVVGQYDTAKAVMESLEAELKVEMELKNLEERAQNLSKAQETQYAARKTALDHFAEAHPDEIAEKVAELDKGHQKLLEEIASLKKQVASEQQEAKRAMLRSGEEDNIGIEIQLEKKVAELEKLEEKAARERVALLQECMKVIKEGEELTEKERQESQGGDSTDHFMESLSPDEFQKWSDDTDKELRDSDKPKGTTDAYMESLSPEEFQKWSEDTDKELNDSK